MILQQIQPQLKEGRAKKRGRKAQAKPVMLSRSAEIAYTKELLAISELCKAEGKDVVSYLKNSGTYIGDAAIGDAPAWLNWVTRKFSSLGERISKVSQSIAEKVTKKQAKATDKQLAEQIKRMSGIDISGLMKAGALTDAVNTAIAANVSLIESIPQQYHQRLEAIILAGFQDGKGYKWIDDEIRALGQSTDKRARFIARDQIGKLNGRFNELRQQSLGIDEYDWSTSGDERVRGNPTGKYPKAKHNHYKRNGERFKWSDPPAGGHPGQDYGCRCTPIPVLDHLLS